MMKTRSTYLYSGPSIRDIRTRIVTVKFQIEDFDLTDHGRDKLLRLLDNRFDPETNTVTLTVDRCPLYAQNLDYAHYLMTVLRAEAEKVDPWEHEKSRQDHSEFVFEGSSSEAAVQKLQSRLQEVKEQGEDVKELDAKSIENYRFSLNTLLNDREDDASLFEYSKSVLGMLGIDGIKHDSTSTFNPTLSPHFDASLPPMDIRHLYLWHYQEKKKVVWIDHSRKKVKEWW